MRLDHSPHDSQAKPGAATVTNVVTGAASSVKRIWTKSTEHLAMPINAVWPV